MKDERSEELTAEMRIALQGYRNPPPPPLEDMWSAIERAHFGAGHSSLPARWRRSAPTWLAIAATLVLGIGIGRFASIAEKPASAPAKTAVVAVEKAPAPAEITPPLPKVTARLDVPYELATNRYLGEAAALLAVLPMQANSEQVNQNFTAQAQDLLSSTRLLLDSPASKDPNLQRLLSDLELVLAQAVHLPSDSNASHEQMLALAAAMKRHEVLPRLQSAVIRGTEGF